MACRRLSVLLLAASLGCAGTSDGADVASVPVCGPIEALAPLPAPGECGEAEITAYLTTLVATGLEQRHRAHVRVSFDGASRVSGVCVESEVGAEQWSGRRRIAERLEAIRNAPPGPACLAGKRLDFNRYEAKRAEIELARRLCERQVGLRVSHLRECLQFQSDWIAVDAPGTNRPAIFVKPEVPDPPGPPVVETASRCFRIEPQGTFDRIAPCILSDGYEVLMPPSR